MKMCFIPHRFNAKARKLVDDCDRICSEYAENGYALTLRQLFYQLVTRNKITNTVEQYEWVGKKVTEARYAGELDWEHIVDRVRVIHDSARWIDAKDRLTHAARTTRIDTLVGQIYRPEVWIEKDALIELAENVCRPWDIPYIAVKAYGSASSLWEARKRFRRYLEDGQLPVILHLGDLDFTGDDCSRFLRDRMSLLTGHKIELRRLALTPDQVEEYELPPQMGKKAVAGITRGDPRYKKYAEKFKDWDKVIDVDGDAAHVWELDALALRTTVQTEAVRCNLVRRVETEYLRP